MTDKRAARGAKFRRARAAMIDGGIRLLAFTKQFSPNQQAVRRRCEQILDVPYNRDGKKAHLLDIFRPRELRSKLPVVLYIHGGGFEMGSKETHRGIGLIYANRNYLVFNINYRLAPKYPYPAALEDVADAYRWVIENAGRYGGDPERIIVGGESAGGNLALGLTICSCFQREEPAARKIWEAGVVPSVCMPLCGMLQVSDTDRLKRSSTPGSRVPRKLALTVARDVSRGYIGRRYKAPLPETALADPLLVMESDALPKRPLPSFYAMAGTADILKDDTRRLEIALNRRGVRNMVRYYPREGHAFHLVGSGANASEFWRDHFAFLSREIARPPVFYR